MNIKPFVRTKVWVIQAALILCFSISAITISNGVVEIRTMIKEHFMKKQDRYPPNYNPVEELDEEPETPLEDAETGPGGPKKNLKHKITIIKKEDIFSSITSFLKSPWIQIAFCVGGIGVVGLGLFTFVRKKFSNTRAETHTNQEHRVTGLETKNEKPHQPSLSSLPTDPVRRKLAEWERSLPIHEKRRSYESIQMWLDRICRSRGIIPIYESVRYGHQQATELDIEKAVQWIEENK